VVAQPPNNIPFTPRFFPVQTDAEDAVALLIETKRDFLWSIWDVSIQGSPVLVSHGSVIVPPPPGS